MQGLLVGFALGQTGFVKGLMGCALNALTQACLCPHFQIHSKQDDNI